MSSTVFQFVYDDSAKKSVEEGGLGYKPPFTSLEGLVNQATLFNKEYGRKSVWE
jgi:hypothetical protein